MNLFRIFRWLRVGFFFCGALYAEEEPKFLIQSKQIFLSDYPDAFNPSLLKIEEGFLLIFRYSPNRLKESWVSYIGITLLNDGLEPIREPQLLTTRRIASKTPSQSEDPRIFTYRGRIFLIFNDNMETVNPHPNQRRDMYLVELFCSPSDFSLSCPIKLVHEEKYHSQWWQKNWVPFEWGNRLFFVYSIQPHEIIDSNLTHGKCYCAYETQGDFSWNWGVLRGSTPAVLVDGEYLSFFHSALKTTSDVSWGRTLWHYFIGAYTFSAEPPFSITKISTAPMIEEGFYTPSLLEKRVVFPGGCVVVGPYIYLAYGKDDKEMWIATLDKEIFLKTLKPVQ